MLAQYVCSSKQGLFRIVRHGHRWRCVLDDRELGRHASAEAALAALLHAWPQARLPMQLNRWRFLPELALAHSRMSRAPVARWQMAG